MQNDCGYISFWKQKPAVETAPRFTEMELAIMEGGGSLDNPKVEKFPFLKSLEKKHLP